MSNTRYRIIPTTLGPYTSWEIQEKAWFGWRYVAFADSKEKAQFLLDHLAKEPLYYVEGNGK